MLPLFRMAIPPPARRVAGPMAARGLGYAEPPERS
jgi:hypothetical protein